MDPFTDDVVQFQQPFNVITLDVHQSVDAVVGFGEVGKNILNLVAVMQQAVNPPLQHLVAENILLDDPIPRIVNTDPFTELAAETIMTGKQQLQNQLRIFQATEQGLVNRRANRTGRVTENPFILLLGKQLPFYFVILEKIIEERAAILTWNHQDRAIVTRAGDFDIGGAPLVSSFLCLDQITLAQFILIKQVGELAEKVIRLLLVEIAEQLPVESPDRLKGAAGRAVDILFKFTQQVIEKGTFTATVRPLENVDLILLDTLTEIFRQFDQAIGEKPICKKGVVGTLDEQSAGIVISKVDRFRILLMFIYPFFNILINQVMKNLKNIADNAARVFDRFFQVGIETERLATVTILLDVDKALHRLIDIRVLLNLRIACLGHQVRTSLLSCRSCMV